MKKLLITLSFATLIFSIYNFYNSNAKIDKHKKREQYYNKAMYYSDKFDENINSSYEIAILYNDSFKMYKDSFDLTMIKK